jgi:hypothetical protein
LKFQNKEDEMAFVKIRFSPKHWKDIIEFDVEMNPIPIDDGKGRDVTVNW